MESVSFKMGDKNLLNVAVVGSGDWGKNHVRTFFNLSESYLSYICDSNEAVRSDMKRLYPKVKVTGDYDEILNDQAVEAIIIASSTKSHFVLAKQALKAKKHVFVEKPLTLKASDAEELVGLAREKDKRLAVGHLLLYHPAVSKLKELIKTGEIGDIYYIYSQRLNLGKIRKDENALWSFGPHDISVALYLLEDNPIEVSAIGKDYLQNGIVDVVFLNIRFKDGKMVNIHLSWLDPHKIRRITVVGSRKMVVFDDVDIAEKLKVFDKGVNIATQYGSYEDFLTLRFGDILIPRISMSEPLKLECLHFLECIEKGKEPLANGMSGLQVVRVLEAAQKSLDNGGIPVEI